MEKGETFEDKNLFYDLEIVTKTIDPVLTITVEAFNVPECTKSFARNNIIHHDDLSGYGIHGDKQKSINLAVQDLHELIENHEK